MINTGVHKIPPWHLLEGDCLEVLKTLPDESVDAVVTDPPAGIAFMGKTWDADKGGRAQWVAWLTDVMRECSRVLKPGGHMLTWALPRTSHWTAMAIEDAGFEVRDCVLHVFGTGFPKSLDVSKALDRLTAPATDAAKQWSGFGTGLKPASEHWWLARKPFTGTVAANVSEHGTGALNIAACRIASTEDRSRPPRTPNAIYGGGNGTNLTASESNPAGRWPPNFILSHDHTEDEACTPECPVAMVDTQSGTLHSHAGHGFRGGITGKGMGYGSTAKGSVIDVKKDTGGASRFFPVFYCAKASKRDRGEGNTHPTVKSTSLMRWLCRLVTPPGGTVLDPFAGSGSTGVAAIAEGFKFIGIEREPEYHAIATKRLSDAVVPDAQMALPIGEVK